MTTLTGISIASTVRASVSQIAKNDAPSRNDAGISNRLLIAVPGFSEKSKQLASKQRIKVIDGVIHVGCRDRIVKLVDRGVEA